MKGCDPCLGIGTSNIQMPRSWQRCINALLLVRLIFAIEESEVYWRLNAAIDSSDTRSPVGVTRACRAPSFTSPGMASLLHDNNLATSPGFFVLPAVLEKASPTTCWYASRSITNPLTVSSRIAEDANISRVTLAPHSV